MPPRPNIYIREEQINFTYIMHICRMNSKMAKWLTYIVQYIVKLIQLLLLSSFIEISELNANRVDPDQTPHSAASDQGQHCLSMPLNA